MMIMDSSDPGADDTSHKRKRRPKSYQGCTQCRLARRKCGEGTLRILSTEPPATASRESNVAEKSFRMWFQDCY